jgi:CelD/BcsL family acetyltransferase involved in cellulose biosynthesis
MLRNAVSGQEPGEFHPLADGSSYVCETVTSLAEIDALSGDWTALLDQSICNRAFSSPLWCGAAWRNTPGITPYVVTAWRRGDLAAILPLAVSPEGEARGPSMLADYNDIVARKGDVAAMASVLEYAISAPKPYQRLNLWRTRADSNCMQAVAAIASPAHLHREGHYSLIRLPARYEEYLASRSGKFRRSLKAVLRKSEENGVSVVEIEPSMVPPDRLPGVFLDLHLQRIGDRSAFHREENAAFVREAFPGLFREQRIRLFGIFQDERLLALDVVAVGVDGLCLWNGGYSPEASAWSPGKLLLDFGIRTAYSMGLAEYDLSRGVQEWKSRWMNQTRDVGRLEVPLA